jgi:hypothetical protein
MVEANKKAFAFPAEVARFLEIEPADVDRLIEYDELPVSSIPKVRRTVRRIYLPDFHAWLVQRSSGQVRSLMSYEEFLRVFCEVARKERKEKKAA